MAVDTAKVAARRSVLALVRAVPAWAWLAGLVAASTLVRYVLARRMVAPWVMVDELIYSELAKSFAASGEFLVRDHTTAAYGLVYPALISPAWAIFDSVPDAYTAAKAINALVMSLAAVPAYFLARRVLDQPLALLAALLTVAVPSMAYTGLLMTENAFYPLFLTTALALVAWLERPSPLRTLLLLALCVLAFLTRAQALALFPALLTAPLLLSGRRALRDYRFLYALVAAAVVGVAAVQAGRGASPLGILGAYEVAGTSGYTVSGVSRWFLYHVAELDLSLGVLPFAALILLAALARALPRRTQIFVVAAVSLSFWLVLEVAAFASEQSFRVEERNMFYVVPLFLIALLVWIERGLPRPAAAAAAVLVSAALPGVLPYASLINVNAVSDTLAILPIWSLQPHPFGLAQIPAVVVLASILAGLLFLFVPRRFALVLPALLLVYFAVSQKPIAGKHRGVSEGVLFAGITNPHRDWIDRAVGRDADVAAIWSGNTDRFAVWENEFFNRSVGTVYRTASPLPGGLPETPLTTDGRTGLMRGRDGRVARARYVLADGSVALKGSVVARDERKGMFLYRIDGPLRQTNRIEGLYPQDTWSGPSVRYTRLACSGGTLAVALQSDPGLFKAPQTVVARIGGRVVGRTNVQLRRESVLRVPLRPVRGTCVVTFAVSPTAIPAVVTNGENPDPRRLGVHFNRFTYSP